MEHIKNIEINNFKSIRHAEIKDCRRVNVFIGHPNVGKSNILEALGLFSIDKPDADFSSFVRSEGIPTLFFNGDVDNNIEIRINNDNRILGILESDRISFHWQLLGEDSSFEKISLDIEQTIYLLLNFKLKGDNKIDYWDSIFQRLPRSVDFYKELGKGYLSPIKRYVFKKDSKYLSGRYDFLSVPNGENIFDIISTNTKIRKEIASLFEVYDLKLLYNLGDKKFSILKNLSEDVIFTIPYKLIADTLQHLIFYKVAVASNKDSILIFEEPEAHMFPPYISKFTSDIMFDKNKNQYFIATHSPYVLNDFMEDLEDDELAIYLVSYKKETGETIIDKMSKEEMHSAYQFGYDFFMNMENFIPQA